MIAGGIAGLAGMTPLRFSLFSLFSTFALIPFALVFLFGLYVFWRPSEGRILGMANLGLAALGGVLSAYLLLWSLLFQWLVGVVVCSVGVLGMLLALAGGSIRAVRVHV
jgi:hypothetical protein